LSEDGFVIGVFSAYQVVMSIIAVLEAFQDGVDNRLAVAGLIILVSRGIAERIGLGGESFDCCGTEL
jgi:hypothetical protein